MTRRTKHIIGATMVILLLLLEDDSTGFINLLL